MNPMFLIANSLYGKFGVKEMKYFDYELDLWKILESLGVNIYNSTIDKAIKKRFARDLYGLKKEIRMRTKNNIINTIKEEYKK